MRALFVCLFYCLSLQFTLAQSISKNDTSGVPLVAVNLGGSLPGGDLAKSYGANALTGLSYMQKFKNNWVIGIEGSAIFGKDIKNDSSIFRPIVDHYNEFTTGDGTPAEIFLYQRGIKADLKFGKLFNIFGPNNNSGLLIMGGFGFLQHKIRIEVTNNNVPSLDKESKKMYDRYTDGFSLSQFIGYMHLGNNRRTNFYIGFEASQGFTQNRRPYNVYSKGPDNTKRLDLMYSIKAGWILPIYKKTNQKYYYN